jgi:hypothetical protein
MGLHYMATKREEDSEDFGGLALSNRGARIKTSSACQKMRNAKADYDRNKKLRDQYVKDAGKWKSRSEKKRIESAQKAMNKYKAEYNKHKAACAEEEAAHTANTQRHNVESAMSRYSEQAPEKKQGQRIPRGEETQRLYDNAKQKKKAYDEAKKAYHRSRGKSSMRKKRDEAKKAYNKAARAYKSARKQELAAAGSSAGMSSKWASASTSPSYVPQSTSASTSRHPSSSSTGRSSATRSQRSSSRDSGDECAALKRAMLSAEKAYKKHNKKEPSQFCSKKKWNAWNKKDNRLSDTWGQKQQAFMHAMCHRR